MKPLICLLFFSHMLQAQWSPVTTFDNSTPFTVIRDWDFFNEQKGYIISGSDGINGNHSSIYSTANSGVSWDSLTTVSGIYTSITAVSDQIIYAVGILDVNPNTQNFYESIKICRSFDGGQTWSEHEIFNTTGVLGISTLNKKCLFFQNDSTGLVCSSQGTYYTNNFGSNWNLVNNTIGKFPVKLGSEIASFYNNDVYLTDVNSLTVQTNIIDCYGIGDVQRASSYGDTLIRNNFCSDGWGNMWYALTISELGGSTNVLHFIDDGISDVAINAGGIYAASGRPLRSIDGGQSFFKQDCTLPSDSVLVFLKLDFVDNNTAYALALHYDSSFFKLMKTTNAGGITTNYITQPLQNVGLTNDLDGFSLEVYPNPAINELNIESSYLLDQLEICDLSGRQLATFTQIQNTHFAVDCQFLSPGNYLVKVSSEGKTFVKQVQIK